MSVFSWNVMFSLSLAPVMFFLTSAGLVVIINKITTNKD